MRTPSFTLAAMISFLALTIIATPITMATQEQRCNYCSDLVAINGIHECSRNPYCSGCYCYDKLRKGIDKRYQGHIRVLLLGCETEDLA